ncbi:MAG: hypothetical protein CBC12_01115 [Candidatus Puniceispirillum sp. TMED52]|nr:MAG: hypothetical protein CBC12_01115 [Candidatus Puniceispirillum sp. TMED52]
MLYQTLFIIMFMSRFITSPSFVHNSRKTTPLRIVMRSASKKKHDNFLKIPNEYSPRGPNQSKYVEYLNNRHSTVILGVGPAGTGKTLFACANAVKELQSGRIEKIVLTRPVVPVEEDIGYLPGSLISKMNPWTRPIFDILEEYYSLHEIDSMIHSGIIEISPLAFMRGRTFKKSFIIADEMQNSSPNQMFMLATRLGEGSRMVITGDLKQSDRCDDNGLLDILNKINTHPKNFHEIKTVFFNNTDVERSPTVSKILQLYSKDINDTSTDPPHYIQHGPYSVFSMSKKANDNQL